MHFDFDDRYQDEAVVGSAINRRDGVLLSVVVHAGIVAVLLLAPRMNLFPAEPANEADVRPEPKVHKPPEFVFVQPRADFEAARPRPRADASDKSRVTRAPERPPVVRNPLPSARGNSSERVEAAPDLRARGRGPSPEPAPEVPSAESSERPPDPTPEPLAATAPRPQPPQPPAGGSLGEALKNLQKYVDKESFNNQAGAVQDLGPLQFDTKGVEFGPWIRRFIAQVRRNWFIPMSAMTMRGRVVLQFNVHKDGRITDLTVFRPSDVTSFNSSAFNALSGSNPTEPLPTEYPDAARALSDSPWRSG
ncbi:MAG: TonB family protein [Acidobacteria bacterium]|nr:TonB family protein [Acidobacteriota bacterium]